MKQGGPCTRTKGKARNAYSPAQPMTPHKQGWAGIVLDYCPEIALAVINEDVSSS